MAHQMTLYVRPYKKLPAWKDWLMRHSPWYYHNIACKQTIWVVYDLTTKKERFPGGITKNEASIRRDMLEDLRRNQIYN